jgi:TPR repeat protein
VAQHNLGVQYHEELGVAKDYAEAIKWYRKAADQNNIAAQTHLGMCYSAGEGVKEDPTEAVSWFRKAADQAYAPAQSLLGLAYYWGRGVAKDNVEGYAWLSLSAPTYAPAARDHDVLAGMMGSVCQGAGHGTGQDQRRGLLSPQHRHVNIATPTKRTLGCRREQRLSALDFSAAHSAPDPGLPQCPP